MRKYARAHLGIVCVTIATEIETLFTRREVGDAGKARDHSRRLEYPSLQHLLKIIKKIENSPVTSSNVSRAAKIWDPEIAYLKGTTRNVKTDPITVEHIPRPIGRAVLAIHVDLMHVKGEALLVSKTTLLGLRVAHHLGHGHGARTTSNIATRLKHQVSSYTSAGFRLVLCLPTVKAG